MTTMPQPIYSSQALTNFATRLLRAVRFEQRLDFEIEPNTLALFPNALPFVERLSGKRIRHELDLILEERYPEKALARLCELDVLQAIDTRLIVDEWLISAFMAARYWMAFHLWDAADIHLCDVYWVIWACHMDDPVTLADRLQMSRSLSDQLIQGHRAYRVMPSLGESRRPSEVAECLEGITGSALVAAWVIAPTEIARKNVLDYVQHWRHVKPTLTGNDLKAMGLKPGPLFGKLLGELRRAWLDGQITTPVQERAYLDQLIAEDRDV